MKNSIFIYQAEDGSLKTEVSIEDDTVWLNQKQMAELFNKDIRTINEHIQNIYTEQELKQEPTIRKFRIVGQEGKRKVTREIEHYSLDVIISVGYRVKSKEGTRFRIWANQTLKEYLIQGYVLDQDRFNKQKHRIQELEKTIHLFKQAQFKALSQSEASGLLSVLTDYAHSFILLNQYDTGNFPEGGLNTNITIEITISSAMNAIHDLKRRLMAQQEATELFGHPKDESFAGVNQHPKGTFPTTP